MKGLTDWMPASMRAYVQGTALLVASAQVGCNLFDPVGARGIARLSPRPVLIVQERAEGVPPGRAEALYAAAGAPKRMCRISQAAPEEGWRACLAEALAMFQAVREGRPAFQ